jgi:hypothetical protein
VSDGSFTAETVASAYICYFDISSLARSSGDRGAEMVSFQDTTGVDRGSFLAENALTMENEVTASLSARLAPLVLPDTAGAEVRLGSLWAERPAVVVFLRHYG